MAESARRIAIGFEGGQVLEVRLDADQLDTLTGRLGEEDRWIELQTADGRVLIELGTVVYVRDEAGEHRIGFAG